MKQLVRAAMLIAAVVSTAPALAGMVRFPMGTPIQLVTLTEVNTKHVHSGDRFYLNVAAPLMAGGETIVPEGSTAVGEVGTMERNGHFGKSGKLGVRLLYIDTPQMRIPLTGEANARGRSGTVPMVGAWVAAGVVAAFLVHGKSGVIRAGTPITAQLDDDLRVYVADRGADRAGVATASLDR